VHLVRLPPSQRVWVFDLDNTLHDARAAIFPAMHGRINAFLRRELGLSDAEADALRRRYWQRYGMTLAGLVRHHGTDPRRFLAETHRFPELADLLVADNVVRHALARLPGRKLVFSNAPRPYVQAVLHGLGLGRFFEAVYTIETMRFRPKPSLAAFRTLLRAHDLDPRRCALVDDALENLRAAKRLGMATVWVSARVASAPYVDLRVASVTELPRRVFRHATAAA